MRGVCCARASLDSGNSYHESMKEIVAFKTAQDANCFPLCPVMEPLQARRYVEIGGKAKSGLVTPPIILYTKLGELAL